MTSQPAAQVQPIVEPPPPATILHVFARVLENVAAGVGMMALVAAGAWAVGAPFESYQWPAVLGLGTFGLLSLVRFSHDEARMAIIEADRLLLRARVRQLDEENDALDVLLLERDRTISHMQSQLVARRNFVGSQPDNLSPTMNDARRLVQWKYGDGLNVTQRWAQTEKAWNVNRYAAALNLLKGAQIVTMKGTQPAWAEYTSPAQALVALDALPLVDLMIQSSESSREGGE